MIEKIRDEMSWSLLADGLQKDILIVAHNQPDYLKNCVESVLNNTENFTLRIWDNASDETTANLIRSFESDNIKTYRSESNLGFIVPNNIMAKDVGSGWFILLNSDTEVLRNWDKVLIGTLLANPTLAQTGFMGGLVDERMVGVAQSSGSDVDYICGYCFCISRSTYDRFGLFDDRNLEFAYFEDSDLSFRLREAGLEIRACYASELVRHFGGKTICEVLKKDKSPADHSQKNQKYMESRWGQLCRERKASTITVNPNPQR